MCTTAICVKSPSCAESQIVDCTCLIRIRKVSRVVHWERRRESFQESECLAAIGPEVNGNDNIGAQRAIRGRGSPDHSIDFMTDRIGGRWIFSREMTARRDEALSHWWRPFGLTRVPKVFPTRIWIVNPDSSEILKVKDGADCAITEWKGKRFFKN